MRYTVPPQIAAILARLVKPEPREVSDIRPPARRPAIDRRARFTNPPLRRPSRPDDRASNM